MSKLDSCWTCRLRRKKCSREKPVCQTCSSLAITCHYSKSRPDWMDGGQKQDEMKQRIKAEIRQEVEGRRKRQYVQVLSLGAETAPSGAEQSRGSSDEPMEDCPDCATSDASEAKKWEALAAAWSQLGAGTPGEGLGDCEVDFTMMYLDHVFPFLFPFYRPGMVDGGRAWLLAILQRSKTLFHTGMALSSYFLTLILSSQDVCIHEVCSRHAWNKLWEHTDKAIKCMQDEMQELSDQGSNAPLLQRTRIMESVAQLLVFEVAMARTSVLDVHLNAALSMVETLFERFRIDNQPDMELVMMALYKPSWAAIIADRQAWNTDQASFHFFLGVLVWADTISSTSINRLPRLRDYHAHIIFDENAGRSSRYLLRLEHYIGCPGWAVIVIAEVMRLGLWKREAQSSGSFLLEELVIRGDRLCKMVEDNLKRIDSPTPKDPLKNPHDIFYRYFRPDEIQQSDEQVAAARIWAHATHIYAMIAVIGWQPEHETICHDVKLVLQKLQAVLSPALLRSLVWPFCVAGCLADPQQEQDFRALADASSSLQAFGTVSQALRIMERIWERRGQLDVDWDFASCFSILGSPVLLL